MECFNWEWGEHRKIDFIVKKWKQHAQSNRNICKWIYFLRIVKKIDSKLCWIMVNIENINWTFVLSNHLQINDVREKPNSLKTIRSWFIYVFLLIKSNFSERSFTLALFPPSVCVDSKWNLIGILLEYMMNRFEYPFICVENE